MRWYPTIYLLQLYILIDLASKVTGLEQIFNELGGGEGSSSVSNKPTFDFTLPPDFYAGKCDPCIPRAEYRIQVIVHGTQNDVYWQQAKSAMEQASRDTGVALEIELHDETIYTQEEIYSRMASRIRKAATRKGEARPDALIVTLPSAVVHQAVVHALQAHMPVFGFNKGYEVAESVGVLGFVAQNENLAGQMVAQELLPALISDDDRVWGNETRMDTTQKKVLFINNDDNDSALAARFQGLRAGLLEGSEGTIATMQLKVDPTEVFETVQRLNDDVFLGCPYDAVVLGGALLVDIAVSALVDLGCSGKTILASFGMSEDIVKAIVNDHLAFTAAPQHYIESVFVVVMASMFATTGKKLSLPQDSNIYLSGPVMITLDNIPTDSVETCREQAFPVCNADGEPYGPMTTTSTTGKSILCNDFGCLPRKTIRIGGVLHGVMTDLFWDPVFAAARQAAVDVGIDLELERIERQETNAIVFAKMAARIESLCSSGVDGIFVTIPDETVLDAIRLCQSLKIPVISVNAGADKSQELGLLQHVGQMEYSAGYGAGLRLAKEGIKEAFCLNHQVGNLVLDERCRGFGDALAAEHPDVVYHGMVETADDNHALTTQAVEGAVAEHSPASDNSWENIGLMLGGAGLVDIIMDLIRSHPKAVVGTFDLSENMFEPFTDGRLRFGVDQQPFLQGSLPVFLLTYAAYTQQTLINDVIETGPNFVDSKPTPDEEQCEATFFSICSILPRENMKMISSGLLIVGYVLVALTGVTAILCMAFVLYYRKKSVLVRVSQPPFLITLCIGCIISSLSIVPMGVQTEYRFVKDQISTGELTVEENPDIDMVDASCMLVPWLHSLGFVMVFSSLFGKIWRVQLIYKAGEAFRRKTVTFLDIAPYTAFMFFIVLALLVAWQIDAPFQWERSVTVTDSDGFALASVGKCTSDDGWYYWLAILCFQVACLFYGLVLCFQTKHIQDELSESSNTFLSVVCIFQVMVLAMPISAMVRDDTQVFYFVRACAVFLQNYSVLCLMFLPKMYRLFIGDDNLPELSRSTRTRPRSSVRVSFADMPTKESSNGSTAFQANKNSADCPPLRSIEAYGGVDVESPECVSSFAGDDSNKDQERAPTTECPPLSSMNADKGVDMDLTESVSRSGPGEDGIKDQERAPPSSGCSDPDSNPCYSDNASPEGISQGEEEVAIGTSELTADILSEHQDGCPLDEDIGGPTSAKPANASGDSNLAFSVAARDVPAPAVAVDTPNAATNLACHGSLAQDGVLTDDAFYSAVENPEEIVQDQMEFELMMKTKEPRQRSNDQPSPASSSSPIPCQEGRNKESPKDDLAESHSPLTEQVLSLTIDQGNHSSTSNTSLQVPKELKKDRHNHDLMLSSLGASASTLNYISRNQPPSHASPLTKPTESNRNEEDTLEEKAIKVVQATDLPPEESNKQDNPANHKEAKPEQSSNQVSEDFSRRSSPPMVSNSTSYLQDSLNQRPSQLPPSVFRSLPPTNSQRQNHVLHHSSIGKDSASQKQRDPNNYPQGNQLPPSVFRPSTSSSQQSSTQLPPSLLYTSPREQQESRPSQEAPRLGQSSKTTPKCLVCSVCGKASSRDDARTGCCVWGVK